MSIEDEYIDQEVKQVRVSFSAEEVITKLLPSLWTSDSYSVRYVAEELGKALLKDYNLRDTGYQLLHEDSIYSQICDNDKNYIDTELSKAEM